jgi:CheY-like chemotaxis protein
MGARVRIIMVEDSPTDAELAAHALKRHGIAAEVVVVATESELSAALTATCPDIIISDNSMPRFSGRHALAIARELVPNVPFIFLSGSVAQRASVDSELAQADACLDKNDLRQLGALVVDLLKSTP